MSKPSSTNYPNDFLMQALFLISERYVKLYRVRRVVSKDTRTLRRGSGRSAEAPGRRRLQIPLWKRVLLGGYSSEVPPLPIPNREVKLTNADGTAVFPWESR